MNVPRILAETLADHGLSVTPRPLGAVCTGLGLTTDPALDAFALWERQMAPANDDPCSRCDTEPAAPHEPAHELDGDPHLCWGCREEIRTMREDAAFAAFWGGDDEGDW